MVLVNQDECAELFARIAHDLRTPIGVVADVLGRLESELDASFTDEQRVFMRLADRALRKLRSFADRLSVLSEIEAGRLEPSIRRMDLREAVDQAIESTAAADARREVEITTVEAVGPRIVLGDPDLCERAIAELVRNALAHARHRVRVSVERDVDEAKVAVEDDGEGCPVAIRGTLFGRFAAHSRSGLGVGLWIAHTLVTAHGGRIVVEDSTLPPGRPGTVGARFVAFLPTESPRSAVH
jgi:signal transduction histidine kinase